MPPRRATDDEEVTDPKSTRGTFTRGGGTCDVQGPSPTMHPSALPSRRALPAPEPLILDARYISGKAPEDALYPAVRIRGPTIHLPGTVPG